jgi:Amt family ammonium transporter
MAKHSKSDEAGDSVNGASPPRVPVIDATVGPAEIAPGSGPPPGDRARLVDYAAMDRKDAEYLNLEYTRGEYVGVNAGTTYPSVDPSDPSDPSDRGSDPGSRAAPAAPGDGVDVSPYPDLALMAGLIGAPYRGPTDPEITAWARSLRRFARFGVWTLPFAAICVALGVVREWPTAAEPATASAGSWLVLTVSALVLMVVGVVSVGALLAATAGRWWAVASVLSVIAGSLLLAPVLGLMGLARPVAPQLEQQFGVGVGAGLETRLFDTTIARWFGVSGLVLLCVAGIALGLAILASRVLDRSDGWLVLVAVGVGVGAAYVGWQFLLVVAAMVLLAAWLGLAWTASRLTPDGVLREG